MKERRRLRRLMRVHKLNCNDVAKIVGRSHGAVRRWSCGMTDVPPSLLRLLEHELKA